MEQKNQVNAYVPTSQQNSEKQLSKHPTSSSILSNNFFQVTINSQRLQDLFRNLNEIINEQNRRLQKSSKDLQSIIAALQNRIQCQSKKNGLLFSKLDMKIGESSNNQQFYTLDVHKKSQQRYQQLINKMDIICSKVGKVQDNAKEDLKNGLVYLKKQIIGDFIVEEGQKQPSNLLKAIPQLSKVNFTSLQNYFQVQIYKLRQSLRFTFDQFYQQKENQRKKKHAQEMLDLAHKKQLLQSNIAMKQGKNQQNYMKIVYPSNRKGTIIKQRQKEKENQMQNIQINTKLTKFPRHMSFNKFNGIQEQIVHNIRELGNKIFSIEHALNQQHQNVLDIKNKQVIIDEKCMILSRKFEKISIQMADIKNILRRIEGQKTEEKSIEQLRNYIKWGVRDLQQKVSKKCSDQDLLRQKNRIYQKISILHQNIIEKADKDQIQKALFFLQGKIKQIIFLIAAEQSQQRQGAIMKVATKCLSCDKQVQRQIQSQSKCKRQMNKISQGQYIKSMTHRVRQKYKKQISKTLTMGNQTFDL